MAPWHVMARAILQGNLHGVGLVISREKPFPRCPRQGNSSTDLRLPSHRASSGLIIQWYTGMELHRAVPGISGPITNLARRLPGNSPALVPRNFLFLDLPGNTPAPCPQAISGGGTVPGIYPGRAGVCCTASAKSCFTPWPPRPAVRAPAAAPRGTWGTLA